MDGKSKTNGTSRTREEQYHNRKTIAQLLKHNMKPSEIADVVGVSLSTVYNVRKSIRENGLEGIEPKQVGRRHGEKRTLTAEQELVVLGVIENENPNQWGIPCCMWTREAVRVLIKILFKIEMPVRTVGSYLKRLNFSVQRPKKRAYKQDQKKLTCG